MEEFAIEQGWVPIDLLPDPYVVLGSDGAVLAANVHFDRRLLRLPEVLRWLATTPDTMGDIAAEFDGRRRIFATAWMGCRWQGTPARLVRLLDVTKERQLIEVAETGLHVLEDVLDALPASLLLVDGNGRIISGNARWHVTARANGLDLPKAGIGANYLEVCDRAALIGDADAKTVAEGLRNVLAHRMLAFEAEYRMTMEGGDYWNRLIITALNGQPGAVIQHVDTTEARREQQARMAALAHFKAIFDGALDGIVILDDDARIISANAAAAGILGRTSGEVEDVLFTTMVVPEEVEVMQREQRGLLTEGSGRGITRVRRRDGEVSEVEYVARANVVPGRHVMVLRDMTAARQLERQLRQSQKMEALGQLTGGIAHDFNNILTVIVAHADLLLAEDAAIGGEERDGVSEALRAAQRGAELVRKLMAFGRQEQLRLEVTAVDAVVLEVANLLRRVLPETIGVHVTVQEHLPAAVADASAVHQVLLNLATNARDAMRERGGELRLTVTKAAGPANGQVATEGAAATAHHLLITVSDDGSGMTDEVQARLFEPFFTTKKLGEGTGLGMSMVYGLMQQMNGRVHVESRFGEGTTIFLRLPLPDTVAEVRAPAAVPLPTAAEERGHESILLVEDDEAIRRLSARVLRRAGYDVTEANDGEDAAECLARRAATATEQYALIVSDIVMPRGGGARVLEAARELAESSRLIWVTGYAGSSYDHTEVHAPCTAPIIQKPWTTRELLGRVRLVLDAPPNIPLHSTDHELPLGT